jgi:diguanylate cyclase (GGDEF)-like protein
MMNPARPVAAAAELSFELIALVSAALLLLGAAAILALPRWVEFPLLLTNLVFPIFAWRRWRRTREQRDLAHSDCGALQTRLGRDALTGLMNREAFKKALDNLVPATGNVAEVLVVFFDLDRFKDVNDTLGHKVGDQLLIEVAERTRRVLDGCTAFARLSGDEFAAIVPCRGGKRPRDYGDALVHIVNQPFQLEGRTVEVAASVGLAVGDPVLDDGHELLRRADAAMYEAKRSQHGGCRIYDETLSSRQSHESIVRAGISAALANGGFQLHYQPLVDARTGQITSVEALLRSNAPNLQNVATSDIIAIAEGTGQIVRLTDWTLDEAIRAIGDLKDLPVAVNVSPIYFRHPDFVQRISNKLVDAGANPRLLTVEVTEGVLISDIAAAKACIGRLRELGIKVFLDDFGTCYSSLNYLQHFELDGLKLDKSFLANIGDRKKATNIIRSMIDFGHSLDMKVVMEGVESDWQVRLLQLLGCDLLQGYVMGVPMSLDDIRVVRSRGLFDSQGDGTDVAIDKLRSRVGAGSPKTSSN